MYMRRPTGSPPGQNRLASLSSTMTTRGADAASRSSKKRPRMSLAPMAWKQPGVSARYERTSRSRSPSPSDRASRGMCGTLRTRSGRGVEGVRHRQRNAPPVFCFVLDVAPSDLREPVELRAAVVLRVAPGGLEPPFAVEAVERGEQRAGLHLERAFGDLLDA